MCSKEKRIKIGLTDMSTIDVMDRVFLHEGPPGTWFVVRPYDFKQALVSIPDPFLGIMNQKETGRTTVIIDSKSKAADPQFAHRLLRHSTETPTGAAFVKCKMFLGFMLSKFFEFCVFFDV